jgi:hypothetical protein
MINNNYNNNIININHFIKILIKLEKIEIVKWNNKNNLN